MTSNLPSITRKYFDHSNKTQLDHIRLMFANDATYSSAVTGLYYGVDDIMIMMTEFFSQYHCLSWTIDQLNTITEHIVEVHFTLNTTSKDGQHSKRSGLEYLIIANGKIKHIEIR